MKANIENLKKALALCAAAHKVDFHDYSDEGQFSIDSTEVPAVNDFRMIIGAFCHVESYEVHVDYGWGFTEVFLYGEEEEDLFKSEVDIDTLTFALPDGWVDKVAA